MCLYIDTCHIYICIYIPIYIHIYTYIIIYNYIYYGSTALGLRHNYQSCSSPHTPDSYGSGPPFLSRPPCLLSPPPFRLPSPPSPSPLSHPSFHFPVPHLLSWVHCITAAQHQKKKASNVDTASHKLHTHRPWLLQPSGISKGPRRIVTTVAFWGTMLTHGALWLIRGYPWGEVGMTIEPWDLGLIWGFQNLGRPLLG